MTHLLKTLSILFFMTLGSLALAQTTETEAETDGETEETTPDPLALSMGEPDIAVGDVYSEGEYTDWEIRCIKSNAANDPCQLYQLLDDGNGNPVAEINIFPLDEGQVAAGATVITPLETLLTAQLGVRVDSGPVRKYPFSWCSQIGCFARIGFSDGDIQAFRRGNQGTLIIVPIAAPDQTVQLKVSLSGFTAGYKALSEMIAAQQ